MSLNKEEAQKNLLEPEVDLDNLLTNFLDKEIGVPTEKGELAPELDHKLKETLREIGMVNSSVGAGLTEKKDSPLPQSTGVSAASFSGVENVIEDHAGVPESVAPLSPALQVSDTEVAVNSTRDLEFVVHEVLQPNQLTTRFRIQIIAAAVAGLLLLLGISGYVWLTPRRDEKQHESATIAQPETAIAGQETLPNHNIAGSEATTATASSQSTTQKSQSRQLSNSSQGREETRLSIQDVAGSSARSSEMEHGPSPDSGTPSRMGNNPSRPAVPMSTPPPSSSKVLIPDLSPSEGSTAIALKDLALPQSPLGSASQPQVALPTAMPAEPVHKAVVTPAVAVSKIQVIYPEMAKRNKVKGNVDVEFSIDENGKVMTARAITGPLVLRKAAEDAVYRARFKPATSNGVNVPANGKITLVFNLENR